MKLYDFAAWVGIVWMTVSSILVALALWSMMLNKVVDAFKMTWWLLTFIYYGKGDIRNAKMSLRNALQVDKAKAGGATES